MSAVKVLVVDDSAVVRNVLSEIFNSAPGIELLAAVPDPLFAMKRMEMQWPDVIVLDIEMPRMDGLTFLRKIMSERPTPVVICSTLTEKGAETTMSAMSAGAVDIVTKPKLALKEFLQEQKSHLIEVVKAASHARMSRVTIPSSTVSAPSNNTRQIQKPAGKFNADVVLPPPVGSAMLKTTESIVAIGTSTGGTQALELILTRLPRVCPGIVIVQHMPEKFTRAFADRLNTICEIKVKEAEHGDRVIPGQALIAPGGKHMVIQRSGAHYCVEVVDGPLVSRHKPSVDVLFRSVAKAAGKNALGVIMTGMGDDGANGLLEMRQAGADTIAQNEDSCVVFGMPKEAIKRGAASRIVGLDEIPSEIINRSSHLEDKRAS
ncbi:MAG: chemotaxis response regulator protein-glutamate methylesterase [Gammaproteobacteria bacterium]|nr:chemotaxis response regulator protein-glutamate methylesterase [Gammaproteobacteria bacterium]